MGVNSAHTAAVSVISDFYPDGWGCEWQNASLWAGGQEATVTAGSGPGRGIHVIQENSKENVIMCQLQPTDTDRDEQNTILQPSPSNIYNTIVALDETERL